MVLGEKQESSDHPAKKAKTDSQVFPAIQDPRVKKATKVRQDVSESPVKKENELVFHFQHNPPHSK